MPGCTACNASKKKCPGGVKGCLVEKERNERKEAALEKKKKNKKKKGDGRARKVKSPPVPQKVAVPVLPRGAQQHVTADPSAKFTEIMNAPRAAPPDVNDPRIWERSSAVQALFDFPEGHQQPGACPECHEPLSAHYFGCSQYVPR